MSNYAKESYSEICEFLGLIGNKYVSKIPSKLLQLFENNKSKDYIQHINPNIPIKDQSLNENTLTMIAMLNLKYWCEDEKEIQRLKAVYENNENLYQEELIEKFNPTNVFKKEKEYEKVNTTEMVEYKPLPFYKKWINKIKDILRNLHNHT